jgi:hypothetical protein
MITDEKITRNDKLWHTMQLLDMMHKLRIISPSMWLEAHVNKWHFIVKNKPYTYTNLAK